MNWGPMTEPIPIALSEVKQSDLGNLVYSYRLTGYPAIVRVLRENLGGGFGDNGRFPYTWAVYFLVDGQWAELRSERGLRREWSSLDRLERWLLSMGFRYFWVRNDLEAVDGNERTE